MNKFNTPFGQSQSNRDIDQLAQQMAMTLKKLKNHSTNCIVQQKFDISDNSVSSFPQVYKNKNNVQDQASLNSVKRVNPIRIQAKVLGRKRVKTISQCEPQLNDESQFVDSLNERKITQFFGVQRVKRQMEKSPQSPQTHKNQDIHQQIDDQSIINNHHIIKSLRQSIIKHKKINQQLQKQIQRAKQKQYKYQEQVQIKLENQKNIVIQLMNRKYSERIYNQRLKQIQRQQNINNSKKVLADIMQKISILKNQKSNKKSSKNKHINQQSNFLEIYGQQRQSYFTNWKKKLDSERLIYQKQVTKINQADQIQVIQQKYFPLPTLFQNQEGQRIIFQKNYLPLYSRTDPYLLEMNQVCQIRFFNIKKLSFQNFLILPYPKIMKIQKRMQMKSYINQIHQKSKDLNGSLISTIFTNNTIFSKISTLSQQMIIMGRSVWQQDSPTMTLKHLLKRYDSIPENIAKYIIRVLIRAYERIKKQLNLQAIILPQNIIFNQRYDVKIDNWIQNQTYRFPEFSQNLIKESKYLYFPPQYKIALYNQDNNSKNLGIWAVGIILYQMLYGKKPFHYSSQQVDYEQFYVMLQIQFPSKPQITECCKDFMKFCLCKPQNRISFEKALKHSFFDSKK